MEILLKRISLYSTTKLCAVKVARIVWEGLEIHHSDQGNLQYLSNVYISMLTHHGIEILVARRGCPWENGYVERLIRTLREEKIHFNDYEDIHEARVSRMEYVITQVYHQKRPHSALGYLTSTEPQQQTLD